MEPRYVCYRLDCTMDYDREVIWAFVQRSGGRDISAPRQYTILGESSIRVIVVVCMA